MTTQPPDDVTRKAKLNYRRSERQTRGGFVVLLCVVTGVFSVITTTLGVITFVYTIVHDVILHPADVNRGMDFFEAAILLIIGLFCGFVTLRWSRRP